MCVLTGYQQCSHRVFSACAFRVCVVKVGGLAHAQQCSLITSTAAGNRNRNRSFSGYNRFSEKRRRTES